MISPHQTIAVVLFDSMIGELKMPLLRRAPSVSRLPEGGFANEAAVRKEKVPVERYFEWVGVVEKRQCFNTHLMSPVRSDGCTGIWGSVAISPTIPPGSPNGKNSGTSTRRMLLRKTRITTGENPIVWEWTEVERLRKLDEDRVETLFIWGHV